MCGFTETYVCTEEVVMVVDSSWVVSIAETALSRRKVAVTAVVGLMRCILADFLVTADKMRILRFIDR